MPRLEFYDRLAGWVAPGGTLFIVGHLHHGGHGHSAGHGHRHEHGGHGHGGHANGGTNDGGTHEAETQPPASASVTADVVTSRLSPDQWEIVTAEESQRTMPRPGGQPTTIHDVVVRATRRG